MVLMLVSVAVIAVTTWATGSGLPVYGIEVIHAYPHDPGAFTQGLVIRDGFFFESTGGYGTSTVRRVHLETGVVYLNEDLPDQLFGEGLTWLDGKLFQLTWQSEIGRIYDQETLRLKAEFSYHGQGWGLTHDGTHLIRSDGSQRLFFFDSSDFSTVREVEVTADGRPVRYLNELEFVRGEIWANVYQTDRIARIDPNTGAITSWIDLSALKPKGKGDRKPGVLNGIAYDPEQDRIFVTGKNWSKMFEIQLKRQDS